MSAKLRIRCVYSTNFNKTDNYLWQTNEPENILRNPQRTNLLLTVPGVGRGVPAASPKIQRNRLRKPEILPSRNLPNSPENPQSEKLFPSRIILRNRIQFNELEPSPIANRPNSPITPRNAERFYSPETLRAGNPLRNPEIPLTGRQPSSPVTQQTGDPPHSPKTPQPGKLLRRPRIRLFQNLPRVGHGAITCCNCPW